MQNTQNFNICEKCGATNPLSAKFCFQCGNPLRNPSQPIQCENCGTANSSVASYCKFCGKPLFREKPRTCPRCHNTVSYNAVVCDKCHFRMPIVEEQEEQPLPILQPNPDATQQTNLSAFAKYPAKALVGNILYCVLSVLFLYVLLGIPYLTPQSLLNSGLFDFFAHAPGSTECTSGFYCLQICIDSIFAKGSTSLTLPIAVVSMAIILSAVTAIMSFIINLARIINKNQAKKTSYAYLFVAIINAILCLLAWSGASLGVTAYLTIAYFVLSFILSFLFKRTQEKVQALHR